VSSLTVGLAASPSTAPVHSGGTPDLIVLIGIAVLLAVAAWVSFHYATQRRRQLSRFASRHGFTYRRRSDAVETGVPAFDTAPQRSWEQCIEGTWQGTPFFYADFRCRLGSGKEAQQARFSLVRIPLDWEAPAVHVPSPEVADRLRSPVPCNIQAVIQGRSLVMFGRPQCRPELLECLLSEALTIRERAPELVRQHTQPGHDQLRSAAG